MSEEEKKEKLEESGINEQLKSFADKIGVDFYNDSNSLLLEYRFNKIYVENTQDLEMIKKNHYLPLIETSTGKKILALGMGAQNFFSVNYDKLIVLSHECFLLMLGLTVGSSCIYSENEQNEISQDFNKAMTKMLEVLISKDASDIHLFPIDEYFYTMTYRGETGIVVLCNRLPMVFSHQIINSVKNKINVDVNEKIIEAKGKLTNEVFGEIRAFRISVMATQFGESLNIRKVSNADQISSLENLSYVPEHADYIRGLLTYRDGIVIVSGATGSGKSMLLYTLLKQVALSGKRILTIEDPIEINLSEDRVIQNDLSLTEKAKEEFKLTVKKLKKAFLRHDPDVVLIQEVRAPDETQAIFEMALEGHLAFTTLHAKNVSGTLIRLEEYLGVGRDMIINSVRGIINQQLAPKACTTCMGTGYINNTKFSSEKKEKEELVCPKCDSSGVKGKLPIYEIAVFGEMDMEVNFLVLENACHYYLSKVECAKGHFYQGNITINTFKNILKENLKPNEDFEEEVASALIEKDLLRDMVKIQKEAVSSQETEEEFDEELWAQIMQEEEAAFQKAEQAEMDKWEVDASLFNEEFKEKIFGKESEVVELKEEEDSKFKETLSSIDNFDQDTEINKLLLNHSDEEDMSMHTDVYEDEDEDEDFLLEDLKKE